MAKTILTRSAARRAQLKKGAAKTAARGAAAVLKKPSTKSDSDEDDEEVVLKKPSAKADSDEESEEEDPKAEEANKAQEAREAVKDVQQKQRVISRMNAENDKLLERIKNNKALVRKATKDLDASKAIAQKKNQEVGRQTEKGDQETHGGQDEPRQGQSWEA